MRKPLCFTPQHLRNERRLLIHLLLKQTSFFISTSASHLSTNRTCSDDTGSYKPCSKLVRQQSNISASLLLYDRCSRNRFVWTDSKNHSYYDLRLGRSGTSKRNHCNSDWTVTVNSVHCVSGTWNDDSTIPWSDLRFRTRLAIDRNCPWSRTCFPQTTCRSSVYPVRREVRIDDVSCGSFLRQGPWESVAGDRPVKDAS